MTTQTPTVAQTSPFGSIIRTARPYLTGWRSLLLLAVIAVTAGAALNWSWLVAAGVAPLLLTALPCVAMCALGLCANKMTGKSCSAETAPDKAADRSADEPSLKVAAQLPRLTKQQGRD